jgi:hypothetical protein
MKALSRSLRPPDAATPRHSQTGAMLATFLARGRFPCQQGIFRPGRAGAAERFDFAILLNKLRSGDSSFPGAGTGMSGAADREAPGPNSEFAKHPSPSSGENYPTGLRLF